MRHRQRRLAGYVESLHRTIRQTWSLQTMHPDYHDLSGDMPESYGQCVPSSYLLFNRLTRRFPREHFSIKSGRVLRAMGGSGLRAVIPTHVWMGWQPSDFSDIGVIDITADQALYDSLPPVVVASHDALLEEKNVVYKEYRSFNTAEEYLEEFTKREPAVRMRIKLAQEAFHNLQRRII
ncbi:MAG TPA: hypothetical protein VK502_00430 [Candidatus Saccharimonadales bacterium]|nr:hypothetical protein [Candidatus Saccharimonadales bacterium]